MPLPQERSALPTTLDGFRRHEKCVLRSREHEPLVCPSQQ